MIAYCSLISCSGLWVGPWGVVDSFFGEVELFSVESVVEADPVVEVYPDVELEPDNVSV